MHRLYFLRNHQNHQISQVQILHDFLRALKIKQGIHIAGNSMGGEIAAFYTMQYPKEVKSLVFFGSPSGIVDFASSFIQQGFRRGFNPFIPTTLKQYKIDKFSILETVIFNILMSSSSNNFKLPRC
mgnify:CR=1 FL=1